MPPHSAHFDHGRTSKHALSAKPLRASHAMKSIATGTLLRATAQRHAPVEAICPAEVRRRVFHAYCQNGGRILTGASRPSAAGRRYAAAPGRREARQPLLSLSLSLFSPSCVTTDARIAYPAFRPVKEGPRPSLDTSSPGTVAPILPEAGISQAPHTGARPPQVPC
jgi:hypothetical protein